MITVYRIQDSEGRGPYKPGVSASWSDVEREPSDRPPFFEEFGWPIIATMRRYLDQQGGAFGCGFRTLDQAAYWFTPSERTGLSILNYGLVSLDADLILAESDKQLVFWRRRPLRSNALRLPWSALSREAA